MIWSRWSGAGNTFLIADEWNQEWGVPKDQRGSYAKRICGAFPEAVTDGLLYLGKKKGYDFEWDFYNSDGSQAEMCGNAARCASAHFFEKIEKRKKLKFLSIAGEIESTWVDQNRIRVLMPRLPLVVGKINDHFHINTGVPHFVIEQNPDVSTAKNLRNLPTPNGSNVTFVSRHSKEGCSAVTFERGVEDFTAACGTGAVAAAIFLHHLYGGVVFSIEMPGGTLIVDNAALGQRPFLEGDTKKEYEFESFD